MCRFAQLACLVVVSAIFSAIGTTAEAQVVTTYYPPQATVNYLPVQRGIFGHRTSYEPFVAYSPATAVTYAPTPTVVAGYPVPFAASTTTAYYAPVAPVTTAYYAPARVTTYYASPAYYVAPAPVVLRPAYYVWP